MAGTLYVGTSGFSYPEWKGHFYPAGMAADQMLQHYSRVFPSVEINNTFYRFPALPLVEEWRTATPKGFRFSIKAHRLITHIKRLKDVADAVRTQVERAAALMDRRGPLLFQFPPSLRCDVPLLSDFLYVIPPSPLAIEFRHRSWYSDEVLSVLAEHNATLAIMESDEDEPTRQFIGPMVYLRLHRSQYTDEALAAWAEQIRALLTGDKDVYAYFTHEDGAPATTYAQQLRALVERP